MTTAAPASAGLAGVRPDELYGLADVCRVLKLHRSTAARLLAGGTLPGVKVGSRWRVLGAVLLRAAGATCAAAPAETTAQRAARAAKDLARLATAKR